MRDKAQLVTVGRNVTDLNGRKEKAKSQIRTDRTRIRTEKRRIRTDKNIFNVIEARIYNNKIKKKKKNRKDQFTTKCSHCGMDQNGW